MLIFPRKGFLKDPTTTIKISFYPCEGSEFHESTCILSLYFDEYSIKDIFKFISLYSGNKNQNPSFERRNKAHEIF